MDRAESITEEDRRMAASDHTSEYSYHQGDWSEQMASTISSAYPDAPAHWSEDVAREMALQEGLELTQDHLDELRALQEYCARVLSRRRGPLTSASVA